MEEPPFKEEEEEVPIEPGRDQRSGNALRKHLKSRPSKSEDEIKEEVKDDEAGTSGGLKAVIKSETEELPIKEEEKATGITPVDLQKKTSQDYELSNGTKDRLSVWKYDDGLGRGTKPKILTINHQAVKVNKPFSCADCGALFRHRSSLVLHRHIHSGEKPYSCSECGACFIRQSHLINHWKTHKGMQRYTCPDCGDSFMQRSSLVNHEKVHSAENPFSG